MTERPIHVVGGGIGGLVTAITAAEAGAPVILHEASARLGGRAHGAAGRPGVNLGPHVAFTDGALLRWLARHHVAVPLRGPKLTGVRILDDGGLRLPVGEAVRLSATIPPRPAPVDTSFALWADGVFGTERSQLMCRLAGLVTFHHDPGSLSARFVWGRWRRVFLGPHRVRWIAGGWSSLIDALSARARALGVTILLDDRVTAGDLPDAPTVVATQLSAAARLLERPLEWPGARTALVDVIVPARPGWPNVVADVRSDLSTCCMIERETAFVPGVVGGPGIDLFQAQLGVPPGTGTAGGVARIEEALDVAVEGWREQAQWSDARLVVKAAGAVDPPGTTWRDRPAIDQGDDRFLAGDAVAAPGVLSETSVNSGVQAARLALDARRRRVFPAAWPSVGLSPERRLSVLASALPGSARRTLRTAGDDSWEVEPVDEAGPGYKLGRKAGFVLAAARGSGKVTTLVSPPRWLPLGRTVSRLIATVAAHRHARRP